MAVELKPKYGVWITGAICWLWTFIMAWIWWPIFTGVLGAVMPNMTYKWAPGGGPGAYGPAEAIFIMAIMAYLFTDVNYGLWGATLGGRFTTQPMKGLYRTALGLIIGVLSCMILSNIFGVSWTAYGWAEMWIPGNVSGTGLGFIGWGVTIGFVLAGFFVYGCYGVFFDNWPLTSDIEVPQPNKGTVTFLMHACITYLLVTAVLWPYAGFGPAGGAAGTVQWDLNPPGFLGPVGSWPSNDSYFPALTFFGWFQWAIWWEFIGMNCFESEPGASLGKGKQPLTGAINTLWCMIAGYVTYIIGYYYADWVMSGLMGAWVIAPGVTMAGLKASNYSLYCLYLGKGAHMMAIGGLLTGLPAAWYFGNWPAPGLEPMASIGESKAMRLIIRYALHLGFGAFVMTWIFYAGIWPICSYGNLGGDYWWHPLIGPATQTGYSMTPYGAGFGEYAYSGKFAAGMPFGMEPAAAAFWWIWFMLYFNAYWDKWPFNAAEGGGAAE